MDAWAVVAAKDAITAMLVMVVNDAMDGIRRKFFTVLGMVFSLSLLLNHLGWPTNQDEG
jgi:hypothetical protein